MKKGDPKVLDNYRPISVISIIYKVFSKVLNERIKKTLDKEQSPDQAGFRATYGCDDHLFVLTFLYERCAEWSSPLWIGAIDFRKAFDSVNHDALFSALRELGVDRRYVVVLERLYKGQTGHVAADRRSKSFVIGKGTKQGDPLSPALFNAVLEVLLRKLKEKWARNKWGLKMGDYAHADVLQNLRFADDILLVARSLPQVRGMLGDLSREAALVGLNLHFGKTKILANTGVRRGINRENNTVDIAGQEVEVVPLDGSTAYLGREVTLGGDFHDRELDNRITKAWGKFMSLKKELCGRHYSLDDRMRLFDAVVTPTILYGSGSWTMTQSREERLRTTQRKMLRKI